MLFLLVVCNNQNINLVVLVKSAIKMNIYAITIMLRVGVLIFASKVHLAIAQPPTAPPKCPTLTRLLPAVSLLDPWKDHIYAFLAKFCFTQGDRFDTEGDGFVTFMKRPDIPIIISVEYDAVTQGGQRASAKAIEDWCKRPELKPLLNREVTFHQAIEDLWNNYNVYDAKTALDKLPDHDTDTKYGPDLFCRSFPESGLPMCPMISSCGGLANVSLLPEYVVKVVRNFCDLIVNDVELNDDPYWRSKYEFDEFLDDCKSKSFYEGIRCLPYNKTVRSKLQKHYAAFQTHTNNNELGRRHFDRIFVSFHEQLMELVDELRVKFSIPHLKVGDDCSGSFDSEDSKTRLLQYILSPADGTFPFKELGQTEKGQNVIFREIDVVEIIRHSCDLYGDNHCDVNCKCSCPPGGNCLRKKSAKESGSAFGHSKISPVIAALILLFNIIFTG